MTLKTVDKAVPCPICGKPDQCSKSEDGLVCCYRETTVQEGYRIARRATAKDGRAYTLYTPLEAWHPKAFKHNTNNLQTAVYAHIFKTLPCEIEEVKELQRRGLACDGYGTMPFHNAASRGQIAADLHRMFGDALFSVPGISKNSPSGKGSKPWLEGPEGLLIPILDWEGLIQAVMIRPRLRGDGPKYLFLSSSKQGGASATPALHIPAITRARFDGTEIWLTEGALKADAISWKLPAIATPANNVEPAFAFLAANPLVKVVLAYDQDDNPQARRITSRNLLKAFDRFPDHDMFLAYWDARQGKGMDDLLAGGNSYAIMTRTQAREYLQPFADLKQEALPLTVAEDREYLRTEWSEALSLKARYGQDMSYVQEWNDFLVWNGTIWEQDAFGPAILYKKHLDERLSSQLQALQDMPREDAMKHGAIGWLMAGHKLNRMNNVVNHLKSEADMRRKVMEIPVVRNVIACPNGTIDLSTGTLRQHTRSDWQQSFCPTKFDPTARCDRWLKLLEDVFLGSTELISYVQKLFGMALTGQPNDHVFPVFCGDGRNGKSTILGTIQQILGSGLAGAIDSQHLCKGTDRHPTWLASFHGKRLMVAQETARGAELHVSLVKHLTGGDIITCRRMHENEWSFQPTHTMILCTNERPNIPESNTAIWSRIALVPFRASFSAENGNLDTSLPTRIMAEATGILNWLVQGAIRYHQEGLAKPEEISRMNAEYREDNDPEESIHAWVAQFELPAGEWVKSGELYQHYFQWTLAAAIKPLGIKNFTISMSKNRGWERRTSKGYREFKRIIPRQLKIGH